jgi:class 3 adenylate cyclase
MGVAELERDPGDKPEKPVPFASRLEVLLFTDIVDSTGIKSRVGTVAFTEYLRTHNSIFESIVAECSNGRVIKHTGDGYFAVFATASEAIRSALTFQSRLATQHWDGEALQARVGVHLGEIAIVRMADRTDVVGSPADVAARIMSLAAGGQTLASRVAADEARRFLLGEPIRWTRHGLYQLKGVTDAVEIWEAAANDRPVLPGPPGAIDALPATTPPTSPLAAPDQLGPYRILGQLGKGGMGTVYKAEQRDPVKRTVALKIIKPGFDSAEIIARFDSERQALARMEHHNIARVLDAGADRHGRPYFVMEYVPGVPITHFADHNKLSLHQRLILFTQICDGVAHAHSRAIIHRDIKPSNVLAYTSEGSSLVKIIDFGIAKALTSDRLTDLTFCTERGQAIGTIDSMSPEQADGRPDIDTRTDVYSLGVLLYELLAGVTPFDKDVFSKESETGIKRIIREVEPLRPSERLSALGDRAEAIASARGMRLAALKKQLADELEWIPLMAMRKERDRRYQSAKGLSSDVLNYLQGRPLLAGPESRTYRIGKRLRKQRRRLALLAGALLTFAICWLVLADSGFPVPGASSVKNWLDHYGASVFRPAASAETIKNAAARQRRALEAHIYSEVLSGPGGAPISEANKNPIDAWTQMQTAAALFAIPETEQEHVERTVNVVNGLFEPDNGCEPFIPGFGWPYYSDGEPSAEAAAWGLSAITLALRNPARLSPDQRRRLLDRLDQIEGALDNCRSKDVTTGKYNGGWNIFANQDAPSESNIYITGIVCQGLIEMHRASAPWHRDSNMPDLLLRASTDWIIRRFDGRGWTTPGRQAEEFNDGLTLQIFSVLLDAEADGVLTLPDALRAQIPALLSDCESRRLDHQIDVAFFTESFHNHLNKAVIHPLRTVRMQWHPWAIRCAVLWIKRCQRLGAPPEELIRTRRVLANLVVTLGDAAVNEAKTGFGYVVAETLFGLGSVDNL